MVIFPNHKTKTTSTGSVFYRLADSHLIFVLIAIEPNSESNAETIGNSSFNLIQNMSSIIANSTANPCFMLI